MDVRHNRTTIQEDDMPKRIVGFDQKERNAICRSVYHSYSHRSREFWKIRLEMLERRDADLEECANRRQDIRDQIQDIQDILEGECGFSILAFYHAGDLYKTRRITLDEYEAICNLAEIHKRQEEQEERWEEFLDSYAHWHIENPPRKRKWRR